MLTFDRGHDFRSYRDREAVINQTYLNWFATRYAAIRSDGRLKHAIPCPGYFKDNQSMCRKSVLDSSGCCPSHRAPTAKTLFTFYPWFEREGFPEFSCVSDFPKVTPSQPQTEVARQQRSRNAANRTQLLEILLSGQCGDILFSSDQSRLVLPVANRTLNRAGAFKSSTRTVVRPTDVRPMIRRPFHAKCSPHGSVRG